MAPREFTRRDLGLMHRAARLYYLDELNQAAIAERLMVSRPTVSRLLAEARRIGIVRISVHDPDTLGAEGDEAARLAERLGIDKVWLAPFAATDLGPALAEPVGEALREAGLGAGDVLLVSSGRTVWELSHEALPAVPGLEIVPTVGGVAEPEAWHQTNEITRAVAERMQGRPHFLFTQAMPSPAMSATLAEDPEFQRVTGFWTRASAALLGVGAPPAGRDSISTSVPLDDEGLRAGAGDVCLNFYRADGGEIAFPGSDRMVRISPEQLRKVPRTIAVAVGTEKVPSIVGGAQAGLFNRLVTDVPTAQAMLDAVGGR
ncbi:sugar-binding transcriptional regulator [Pseudonocardia parietis]|uniref:DNA-binding transcriptional regulator LsrR (DeoR family) n=1 Tax=Pseudonocardia parietis TaxID=570936 RepID=A0ABS4VKE0_9PSEU|nr:sugar-binding domain-containing protein [Pseudonocardia parietis]MBP2364385.1 DNA-binding transcriptional regulator LsrR (DeoR family) [Pseudonocardia parietis]